MRDIYFDKDEISIGDLYVEREIGPEGLKILSVYYVCEIKNENYHLRGCDYDYIPPVIDEWVISILLKSNKFWNNKVFK
jgi:hypothetical protein